MRICDVCNKDKELKNGKTCEKGHFVCAKCLWKDTGFFTGGSLKYCPYDGKTLR
jgi:hypothetical protein